MAELCGMGCCAGCGRKEACGGCEETGGRPFGGPCAAAQAIEAGGQEGLATLKRALAAEINALGIPGLRVRELAPLNGDYINLEYRLANGSSIKLLRDDAVYLAAQVERPGMERCYGIAADERYILVCEYGCGGSEPEIVAYLRRRQEDAPGQ